MNPDHCSEPARQSIAIFGAPLDSGNLGVSALSLATIYGLKQRMPGCTITLFDNGRGLRRRNLAVGEIETTILQRGAWLSRRLYRAESLWSMLASSYLVPWLNVNVRVLEQSTAVLDISGGDSFTDLYGSRRFSLVTLPKRTTLRRNRPLYLLPQTYGPFNDPSARTMAHGIVRRCERAWARDPESFERLRELAGNDFQAERYRLAADVAFSLPARNPVAIPDAPKWANETGGFVGLNISGLLYHDPLAAQARFGLQANYAQAMADLVRRFLERTDERILLIPHVTGDRESDDTAGRHLSALIGQPDRVAAIPARLAADEVKSVISRCTWFAGARMHSTIAALSTCVPAAAFAYSSKFQGVFDGCGVGHSVLDLRRFTTRDLVDAAFAGYRQRDSDRAILESRIPSVRALVSDQFDDLALSLQATSVSDASGER